MEHTVASQNGHVKQTVVKNNYDNYQNVCNLVTVHRGSFQFTSSSIFKYYTYLFFNCCIVGAGNISGTQCIQPLPSCIIIFVIYTSTYLILPNVNA
jgi:hypothetical protein